MIINFMEELNDKFTSNNFVVWIGSKLSKFIKNKRKVPMSFDLLDNEFYTKQLINAQKYEEKSKLGKYGFYGFGFVMCIIFIPDNFFSSHPSVSKNPTTWGEKHAEYEKIILDDYGIHRRGTDMAERFNKLKGAF